MSIIRQRVLSIEKDNKTFQKSIVSIEQSITDKLMNQSKVNDKLTDEFNDRLSSL